MNTRSGGCVAGKPWGRRTMSVIQTFDARIKRFAALRSRRYAINGVDIARLSCFVTEIIAIAKQVVAVGWNPTHGIGVVVLALPKNVADARSAKIRREVAVCVGRARSSGPRIRAGGTYRKQDGGRPQTAHLMTETPQTKGSVR